MVVEETPNHESVHRWVRNWSKLLCRYNLEQGFSTGVPGEIMIKNKTDILVFMSGLPEILQLFRGFFHSEKVEKSYLERSNFFPTYAHHNLLLGPFVSYTSWIKWFWFKHLFAHCVYSHTSMITCINQNNNIWLQIFQSWENMERKSQHLIPLWVCDLSNYIFKALTESCLT